VESQEENSFFLFCVVSCFPKAYDKNIKRNNGMAKIGFIQNIKTWAHKKTVANFVKRTEKELSAFEEIEICIPDNVTKALAREKNEKAYLEKKLIIFKSGRKNITSELKTSTPANRLFPTET